MMFWRKLITLFAFSMFFAAQEDGGIGDIDDDDFVIEDDDDTPPSDGDKSKKDGDVDEEKDTEPKGGADDKIKKELEELKAFKEEAEREKAIFEANNKLVSQYPDFDLSKITEKLKEIHKDNPEEAERLNNPTGWENLYLKYFRSKDVKADPFDAGRGGAKEPFDFEATQKRALSGDKRAMKELFENAK